MACGSQVAGHLNGDPNVTGKMATKVFFWARVSLKMGPEHSRYSSFNMDKMMKKPWHLSFLCPIFIQSHISFCDVPWGYTYRCCMFEVW